MRAAPEGNEIQDSEILEWTRVEHGAPGMMRLVLASEDSGGEPALSSEWFEERHKAKAVIPWMASVRALAVKRFQEQEEERRAKAQAMRAARVPPAVTDTASAPPPAEETASPSRSSPVDFARHHYRRAYTTYRKLLAELETLKPEVENWKTVLIALGAFNEEAIPGPSGGSGSDDSGSGGTAHDDGGGSAAHRLSGSPDRL